MGEALECQTESLCQAIVSGDLQAVEDHLKEKGVDANRRHCTKQTPLQIACTTSTPEIVTSLLDHGAKIAARTEEGQTALHLAAARGAVDIIRVLRAKSDENKRVARERYPLEVEYICARVDDGGRVDAGDDAVPVVKIVRGDTRNLAPSGNFLEHEKDLAVDICDPNTVSWGTFMTPLHIAIFHGNIDAVKELVSFGADLRKPITIYNRHNPYQISPPSLRTPKDVVPNLTLALCLGSARAQEMSRALLQLGASPAELDLDHNTPLHYVACLRESVPIQVFLQSDRDGTTRALNHLSLNGPVIPRREVFSPLSGAIAARNPLSAIQLLEAGARPFIPFDSVMSTLDAQLPNRTSCFLHPNKSRDKAWEFQETKQPIMAAVENEFPLVVHELLNRGADPNTHCHEKGGSGKSVLDIVRQKIQGMRDFLAGSDTVLQPPEALHDDQVYLAGIDEASYKMWITKIVLRRARRYYDKRMRDYKEEAQRMTKTKGMTEKFQGVNSQLLEFQDLEKNLLARGAKTFRDLHPDHPGSNGGSRIKNTKHDDNDESQSYAKINFSGFEHDADAYVELFEAAWKGEIETIKHLTLDWQNAGERKPPLNLEECDALSLTPLSIVILRGHFDAVPEMLDIMHAQHRPHKPLDWDNYDEDGDEVSQPPDTDGDSIISSANDSEYDSDSEGVSKKPKLDPVQYVKCRASPLTIAFLRNCSAYLFTEGSSKVDNYWFSDRSAGAQFRTAFEVPEQSKNLLEYSISQNDLKLLGSLIQMAKDITAKDHRRRRLDTLLAPSFSFALKMGRTECVSVLIEKSGAGLPIDSNDESDFEISIEGLSDSNSMGDMFFLKLTFCTDQLTQNELSPLLAAARAGSLASTRWMMGPEPAKLYMQYIKSHEKDHRVQRFLEDEDGLEKAVLKWLRRGDDLVLHCAISAVNEEESQSLVRDLVTRYPEHLEVRSTGCLTPLAFAFVFRRPGIARLLLDAGASTEIHDESGHNVLHLLLVSPLWGLDSGRVCNNSDQLREMLGLLDRKSVCSMLQVQNQVSARTPLMHWIKSSREAYREIRGPMEEHWQNPDSDDRVAITKVLLGYGDPEGQDQLELRDKEGNTPVHVAVMKQFTGTLKIMLDHRPDLLHWENARGKTPIDLARHAWAELLLGDHSPLNITRMIGAGPDPIVKRDPALFIQRNHVDDTRLLQQITLDICDSRLKQSPGPRKLFTLKDAFPVAECKAPRVEGI